MAPLRALAHVVALFALLACARAEIPTENPWGEMSEDAQIAYLAASAQSMMSESYNFTRTLDGAGAIFEDAGELGSISTVPGPPGIPVAWSMLEIGPCAMLMPHTHPMGNELEYTLAGDKLKGGLVPMGSSEMLIQDIPPGTLSIYPQGLMHLQFNTGCDRAKIFVTFDKPFPSGLIGISNSAVAMPAWMLAASLNAYGTNLTAADLQAMQATIKTLNAGQLDFAKLPADQCDVCT